ncbi:GH92 family glycosyl hydrolase [Phocaeicola sp.]|uniref:GH92 family glycosyl hydrolase n=1 Tax=Phocaeicola sp. TaxID=2773926 RepID=UPI003AB8D344
MRKLKISVLLKVGFFCLFLSIGLEMQARKFVHPGILHTTKSIERMRAQIADKEYPAYGSFELLKSHHCSQADYQPFGPFEIISRDGEFRHTKSKMEQDFSAIYQNALMWVLTGEKTHAEKSLELLLGYAGTLKRIPETNDAPLLVGLEGLKIIYATEILRHTYKKMTVVQFNEISRMIREVFLPVMENFYHRKPYTNGNWGPIVTKAYMAAAILWDNEEMYNKAVDFYLHANDNGTIAHYISGDTGQIQESGRDQGHSMLGIGALATVCEIAWQQGDDLYSALDNRLMKGFEYVAKYNLGYNVPFAVWKDVTGKYSNWTEISNKGRGRYMPIFEMAYNHFVIRKGMQMPYTEQVLRQIRPEGYDRDQPAFGSLLFNEAGTKKNYVDLVNPFVDSHRSRWFFFSSACRPFGMVSLSPDTDTEHSWGSGYLYDSKQIRCFSHVHNWQMSGVAVMPTVGEFKGHLGMNAYQSAFTHDGEIAKPGYHKVKLTDYDITAELTSTMRVGFHCYTFPKSDASYILFDTGAFLAHGPTAYSEVWKVSDKEIAGWEMMERTGRRPKDTPVYFYAQLSKPMDKVVSWREGRIESNSNPERISGKNAGMAVRFKTEKDEKVMLKVAISYVSVEQARKNMLTELSGWDFEQVKQSSFSEWNDWLGRIEVEGGSREQQIKLYTDLWHALLGRHVVSDADGHYMDMTSDFPRIRQIPLGEDGKPLYNHHNFDAWWGSHWSLNILWSMAYPEVMDNFCNTMIDMYQNGGLIPRGPSGGNYTYVMIGDPAVSFFASAYNKGIRNYDAELAYEGLRKNAFVGGIRDHAGYEHSKTAYSGGMKYYEEWGYVPDGRKDVEGMHTTGASMTLEYAYQGWCLAQMAKTMGKLQDYEFFMKRSKNYRNLWNPESGYMQSRGEDGNWLPCFDPLELTEKGGFCESNSAIYSHYVPHDMAGLIELYGGADQYVKRLNANFEKSESYGFFRSNKTKEGNWTDYGNQPGTGMAHLFSYAGAPWLTQKWVRKVKAAYCDVTPYGGYRDDEDQGQMGALGVLMAIGLFEVDGGCAEKPFYEITSPLFDKVTIHLDNRYYSGKTFQIITKGNSTDNMYIQNASLNGKKWNKCWFYHEDFIKGGTLELKLGAKPNKKWGVEELPPSFISSK